MYSLRDIIILSFLLGSSAICFASHVAPHTDNYGNHYQHQSASGLDRILKPVNYPESIDGYRQYSESISQPNFETNIGSFQNSGYSYTPKSQQVISSYNNDGYQYISPNNGNGYHYENPSQPLDQTLNRNKYGSNYNLNNNLKIGYQTASGAKISDPVKESYHMAVLNQGQSSNNVGYYYNAPTQDFYGNIQHQPSSKELGYSYDKPKQQSSSLDSILKGQSYLPSGLSSPQNNYQFEQNQGFKGQIHSTNIDGYQYQSPKYSGYNNFQKPQRPAQTESSFKGQSYLPTPSSPSASLSSSTYLDGSPSQGYSYEKPAAPFKGESYLPLSGW